VSDENFPEIQQILEDVKRILGYDKDIEVFIVEEGSVNAALAKFFRTRFIVLNSELVRGMLERGKIVQMKWVIARFVGALQAKHYRLDLLRILVDNIEKLQVLNLFLLPYERATQYSGDQIALAVCGDLEQSMIAFEKLLVGNDLSNRVGIRGILEQAAELRGDIFAFIARLGSSHPHMVSRCLNLLSFARSRYPQMFAQYLADHPELVDANLDRLLPAYDLPLDIDPLVLGPTERPQSKIASA